MSDQQQPPQSVETEQQLIGEVLKDQEALEIASEHLTDPNQFYSPKHQLIFRAMQNLAYAKEPCDITTVSNELSMQGRLEEIGGRLYLVELIEAVITAVNVGSHAKIIAEKASYRDQIALYQRAIEHCFNQTHNPTALIALVSQKMTAVSTTQNSRPFRQLSSYMTEVMTHCHTIQQSERTLGTPYGFMGIDKLTGGAQPGDLVVIAGRPSMGKTALANCMAANQCMAGHKIAVFSAETRGSEYALRSLCTQSKVDSINLKQGKTSELEWEKMTKGMGSMSEWNYWVDDTPGIEIHELIAKASRLKRDEDIDIIYVDYLQKITSNVQYHQTREMYNDILSFFKGLAQNLSIPVVVLSQLSRELERRKSKVPTLSDLKETGNIEQDADLVLALYRPEWYATKAQKEQKKFKNINEVHLLKQRNGPVGTVELFFNEVFTRFEDMPEPSELPF